MNLHDHKAKLNYAREKLALRWHGVCDQWHDEVSRGFEERFLETLEPKLASAIAAMDQLNEILTKVRKECE